MNISPVAFRGHFSLPSGTPQPAVRTPLNSPLFAGTEKEKTLNPLAKSAAVLTLLLSTLTGTVSPGKAIAAEPQDKAVRSISDTTTDTPEEAVMRQMNNLVAVMLLAMKEADLFAQDLANNTDSYFRNITPQERHELKQAAKSIAEAGNVLKKLGVTPEGVTALGKNPPSPRQVEAFVICNKLLEPYLPGEILENSSSYLFRLLAKESGEKGARELNLSQLSSPLRYRILGFKYDFEVIQKKCDPLANAVLEAYQKSSLSEDFTVWGSKPFSG